MRFLEDIMKRTNKLFQSILASALLATISIPMRGMGPRSLKELCKDAVNVIVQSTVQDYKDANVGEIRNQIDTKIASLPDDLKEEIKQDEWVNFKTLRASHYIQFSPDGKYLLISSGLPANTNSHTATILDCHTWAQVFAPSQFFNPLNSHSSSFSSMGNRFAVACCTWIGIYDTDTWNLLPPQIPPQAKLVRFSPNADWLAYAMRLDNNEEGTVVIEQRNNGQTYYSLDLPMKIATGNDIVDDWHILSPAAWSPDSNNFAYITTDNTILVRNLATQQDRVISIENKNLIFHHVEFSPDGRNLLIGSVQPKYDNTVDTKLVLHVWNIENRQIVKTLESDSCVKMPLFSPDGKYFCVSAPYEEALIIYKTQTWKIDKKIKTAASVMTFVGNNQVAVAIKDKIKIYNIDSGTIDTQIDVEDRGHAFLVASPDGSLLAHRYSYDQDVYIWTRQNLDANICVSAAQNIIDKAKKELSQLLETDLWNNNVSLCLKQDLKRKIESFESYWPTKKQKTDNN